jgi:triphosphatase
MLSKKRFPSLARCATFRQNGSFTFTQLRFRIASLASLLWRKPLKSQSEIELKLALPPESLPAVRKMPILANLKSNRAREVSVYFDTEKHKLRKRGLILRVRRLGDRYVQTIKAAGNSNSLERGEWEAEIGGENPDLDLAQGTPLEPLVSGKLRRQIKPLFETRVRRAYYPLADDMRAIALTIDQGTIDTGKRSQRLCEIELELDRGSASDLFEVAREFVQVVPARLVFKSKSDRGYELLDSERETPVKTAPLNLQGDASSRDAFAAIARTCLEQVTGNEFAVLRGDPEGVHQMRVGLRRLRAAMSLFADLLDGDQTAAVKDELKWLTGELGPARELEVLAKRVVAPIRRHSGQWQAMRVLAHELARKRETAVDRAGNAVQSERYRALTLDVARWLHAGDWRSPRDDLVRDRGDLPIRTFAAEQLTRRWRKLRKKGKALAQLDAHGRHKLRIQTKKIRYGVEFFVDLFAGKRATRRRKRLAPSLKRLQNALGELNDIAVSEKRIAELDGHQRSNANRAFAAGLLTGHEDAQTGAAMRAAKKACAEMADLKPFWT